jgi:hypothetical protein
MMWAEIVNANCSRASSRTSLVSSIRLVLLAQPHRGLLLRVHVQAEDTRQRVIADGIEIVLAANYIIQSRPEPARSGRQTRNRPKPSKIERAAVDPQVSSLIEIARVLGLELMFVPKQLVPAVQALQREAVPDPRDTGSSQLQAYRLDDSDA